MITLWKILTNALYVLLIALCLSDMKQRNKANMSRLLFIVVLIALLAIIYLLGGY